MNVYIDESGNTGDITNSSNFPGFAGQPIFSLAAIAVQDIDAIDDLVIFLRSKYKIQSVELKAASILKNKPDLVLDICKYLTTNKIPFFIEVTDKKYQILVNIVAYFIDSLYFSGIKNEIDKLFWMYFITILYNNKNIDNLIEEYLKIFPNPDNDKVETFFVYIKQFIASNFSNDIDFKHIPKLVEASYQDFLDFKEDSNEDAHLKFIAPPDINKRETKIWLLPHYSCFTSIIARINKYLKRDINSLEIIHDENAHFDIVIEQAKKDMENNENNDMSYIAPYVDPCISGNIPLSFASSHDSSGIQIADILAGLMTHALKHRLNKTEMHSSLIESIDILLSNSNEESAIGVNLVAGTHDLEMIKKRFEFLYLQSKDENNPSNI